MLLKTLAGELDFDLFCDRLLALQQTIPASDPARKLLFSIIAKIDEYESSEITDEQLRGYLLALLPTVVVAPSTIVPKLMVPRVIFVIVNGASPWFSTAGATGPADLDPSPSPIRAFALQGRSTGLVTIGGH